ncbi:MAG: hypothetical protein RLZZ227_1858 [Pseudomonadota bacterium]|jgi:hypothetical protein
MKLNLISGTLCLLVTLMAVSAVGLFTLLFGTLAALP